MSNASFSGPLKRTFIRLKKVPSGAPTADHFEFLHDDQSVAASELKPDEVLVRALWVSVDPYIRGRLYTTKKNTVMTSSQIAQVVVSNSSKLRAGDIIVGNELPWATFSTFIDDKPGIYRKIVASNQVKASTDAELPTFLGPLGLIGVTAYQGLLDVGALKKGETVFVSGAAGAVGSMVVQIAKQVMGCRVIGVAGSDDKCKWLKNELQCDATLNYKRYNGDMRAFQKDLRAQCPNGIDVYFDNTGGFITESVWALLNYRARVVVCGQIANYNALRTAPKINDFLFKLIYKEIRIEGFAVYSFKRYRQFYQDMRQWMEEGKIIYRTTVKNGIESVPDAFMGLFTGENFGKMLVKIDTPQIGASHKL